MRRLLHVMLFLAPAVLLAAAAHADVGRIFSRLVETGDYDAAEREALAHFDEVIASAATRDADSFTDAAFALRLIRQLKAAEGVDRAALLRYLLAHEDLARTLAFLLDAEHDDPAKVYALLERLVGERGEAPAERATLTAAICVVHDEPLTHRINENRATADDPLALFDYFVGNERRLLFGLREVPAELLIYVVDSTASVEEMRWALSRYEGDTQVGRRFFDIDYDWDHFANALPKKVTVAGWNLRNIARFGGVCADQAYFAMSVGKAIGVPTAYAVGRSGEVGHAWVGFLQSDGRRAWWNFDTGRYEAYQGVRGVVRDPQTRQPTPDSSIALLADFISSSRRDRLAAAALTDAAQRLIELEHPAEAPVAAPPLFIEEQDDSPQEAADEPAGTERASGPGSARRMPGKAAQLELLEAALRRCPGYAEAWLTVRDMAEADRLTLAEKKRWGGVVHRLCGRWYPDFYFDLIAPMVRTVDDVAAQNRLWNAAFRNFGHRADLAAAVRMEQARMWLDAGEADKAGQCYVDVIERFANAGPFILEALTRAEAILREAGDAQRVLRLYEHAWSQIDPPKDMAAVFARRSNWVRVGTTYAERLDAAGDGNAAAEVRATLTAR